MFKRIAAGFLIVGALAACSVAVDPLEVLDLSPVDGATGVSIGTTVSATFSRTLAPDSLEVDFTLSNAGGEVAGTVDYDETAGVATFTPDADLAYDTTYEAVLSGGVEAEDGGTLGTEVVWTFTTESVPPAIGGLVVTPASDEIDVGASVTFAATPTGVVGTPDMSVAWTSSDETIADVSASGVVTGVAAGGPVTITATSNFDDSVSASATVTVLQPTIDGIEVAPAAPDPIAIGGSVALTATPTGVVGSPDLSVEWTSSAPGIADVSASGVVTGVAAGGPVTITATSSFDDSVSASATVTVASPVVFDNYILTADAGSAITPLTPSVTGGVAPYSYFLLPIDLDAPYVVNGLPPGVTLDEDTGVISGTPEIADYWHARVEVTDAIGQTQEASAEIDINLLLSYASPTYSYPTGIAGTLVPASDVTVTGAWGPEVFSMELVSSDPIGGNADAWAIDAATGAISRNDLVAANATSWEYLVTVLDDGGFKTAEFTVVLEETP